MAAQLYYTPVPPNPQKAMLQLLAVVLVVLSLPTIGSAIRFDVTPSKTCLVYFVDGTKGAPNVHIKYETNVTDPTRNGGVDVVVMDPKHNERYRHRLEAPRNSNWHRVPVDISNKALAGFSMAGEYTVCFSSQSASLLGSQDHIGHAIHVRNGDAETVEQLKHHSRRNKNGDAPAPNEKEQCTADSIREKLVLLDAVHREMVYIAENAQHASNRLRRFAITSNSTFTRVWFVGLLTIGAIAGSLTFSYKAMQRIIKRKRLV